GVDGMALLFLDAGLFFIGAHGFAEALDRIAQVRTQALEALGAEQHDHDQQDNQELPDANSTETHDAISENKSVMRARGFFRVSGKAETAVQLVQYRLWVLVESGEHDQTVKPQVGGLADQLSGVAAGCSILGGKDGFHRLLADPFQNLAQALVIEPG